MSHSLLSPGATGERGWQREQNMGEKVEKESLVYVSQYCLYWSMPRPKWIEICKRMSTDRNANYNYNEEARSLKRKPTNIIPELIHKTLDWKIEEWRYALYDETKIMICVLCCNETKHEPDEQCSECGGCEHCCMGAYFRACEEELAERGKGESNGHHD